MTLRVLVVDDSATYRRAVADALTTLPDVEVVGSAANGRLALQKVRELRPDLVTLDIEMPELDGLAVLDALAEAGDPPHVVMVSGLTRRGGDLTVRALERGAFDFVTKPEAEGPDQARAALVRELGPRLRALAHRLEVRSILRGGAPAAAARPRAKTGPAAGPAPSRPELVLVGVSTGGPAALARLLPALPADLGAPVLVVQHMPPVFTQSLAESLSRKCALRVREADHGETAEAGTVYLAPGGRHLRLAPGPDRRPVLHVTDDPPENNCRPSVDYLFRSASTHFPGRCLAVVLTGMGNDGTLGLRLLKRHGCQVLAQDEATSVVYGMPKAAVEARVVDALLPLDAIAPRIVAAVRG